MKIRILGAHHSEIGNTKYSCFLIDGILAIDAGALTSILSIEEQKQLRGVLLTHGHFDHIRDIPTLASNLFSANRHIDIYSAQNVKQIIEEHLLNDIVYPDFWRLPIGGPTLQYHPITPGTALNVESYTVLSLPGNHTPESLAYCVIDRNGNSLCYTGDSGPGLSSIWPHVEPDLLIIEVTMPDRMKEFAQATGHLTPALLARELEEFRRVKSYLPTILSIHLDQTDEMEIRGELLDVSRSLNTHIALAYEGLEINLETETNCYHLSDLPVAASVE